MSPFDRFRNRTATARRLRDIRLAADKARDAGNWEEAADGYQAYLREKPEDAAIFVQLGNMLKECGRYDAAHAAYQSAQDLEPGNADTALMSGHLFKRRGDFDEAEALYKTALQLDPGLTAAFRELAALGAFPARLAAEARQTREPAGARQAVSILLDLSDVFKFLQDNATVSGIQRVQLAMTESLLQSGRAGLKVSFLDEGTRAYYTVDPALIFELCTILKGHGSDHGRLKALVRSAMDNAQPYIPQAGDVVFVAGAFWMLPDAHGIYTGLKQAGVRIGVYIYDVIPVTHPEFCAPELVARFTRSLFHFLKLADFIFTISDYSGAALIRCFKQRITPLAPVSTVHLAHAMPASAARAQASAKISRLLDEDYVLFVSTIEARKNHMYLFRAWQRLAELHPDKDLPKLVFVGRPGWRVSDLMDAFKDTHFLNGRLKVLHGVGDADLALLYENAKFTCFPSFIEGWGLPIGESLAYGVPCVASKTSSMPEVGGDMVDYIDPLDISGGVRLFEDLLFKEGELEKRRARIASNFKPVPWSAVAAKLLNDIDAHIQRMDASERTDPSEIQQLQAGYQYCFEDSLRETNLDRIQHLAEADFVFDERWSWGDDQSKWLIGRTASFQIQLKNIASGVDAADKSFAPVMMTLRSKQEQAEDRQLRISKDGKTLGLVPLGNEYVTVLFSVPLDSSAGVLAFDIQVEGPIPRDSRLKPYAIAVTDFGIGMPVGTSSFTVMTLQRT